jgi:hypothetical protein
MLIWQKQMSEITNYCIIDFMYFTFELELVMDDYNILSF